MNESGWIGVSLAAIAALGGVLTLLINRKFDTKTKELELKGAACEAAHTALAAKLDKCEQQHATTASVQADAASRIAGLEHAVALMRGSKPD